MKTMDRKGNEVTLLKINDCRWLILTYVQNQCRQEIQVVAA